VKTNLCLYQGRCAGCAWLGKAVSEQRREKAFALSGKHIPEKIQWVDCGNMGLRDRVDLTWEDGRLGLFELGDARRIVDLENCPMLSSGLQSWLETYRMRTPPIQRGSIRLRVSPQGLRGVWLDFSNQDVKKLFEEKEYLLWLSSRAIVEIGQRRKRFVWIDGQPKLREPQLEPWFETPGPGGRKIPLYTTIAGFTQTGFRANEALVGEVVSQASKSNEKKWLELFAGSGNFSLALAAHGYEVTAIEMDERGIEGMHRSAVEERLSVDILRSDLYRAQNLPGGAWLVDPPRSGLKNLLQVIEVSKPTTLIYVSCWSESFSQDAEKLSRLGYRLTHLSGVDQFVHSPHVEWVATFNIG
jgi:23S rRNA (uracil1939-C5)-methyltransferase